MINCIFIGGPTASGKTSLSIRLAQHLKCEILSADSRQIYKELNIGVAKPSEKELSLVPHHGINITSIHQAFNAGLYEKYALGVIEKQAKKNKYLIIAGGTGLYFQSVLEGLDEFPEVPRTIQQDLQIQLTQEGLISLVEELKHFDPKYAQTADLENSRRVIRALAVIRTSGKPFSSFLNQPKPERPFQTIGIQLHHPREELYVRINQRVDKMMASGLLDEVHRLYPYRHLRALQTVGYREFFPYFEKNIELADAILEVKKNSRRYAKRQITWFNNQTDFPKYHPDQWLDILKYFKLQ